MQWSDEKKRASMSDLEAIETYFDIRLPALYIDVQLQHHGARPRLTRFNTDQRMGAAIKSFLPITKDYSINVFAVASWLSGRIGGNMFPFAGDSAGNYLCLYYQYRQGEPVVVFWNHEKEYAYEFVADSFGEFLSLLY